MRFQVETIIRASEKRGPVLVVARRIDHAVNYKLDVGMTLGGVPVRQTLPPRSRAAQHDGSLCAFQLLDHRDSDRLAEGTVVELEPIVLV